MSANFCQSWGIEMSKSGESRGYRNEMAQASVNIDMRT